MKRRIFRTRRWWILVATALLIGLGGLYWGYRFPLLAEDPHLIDSVEVAEPANALAVNSDGSLVAIGDQAGRITLWQPDSTAPLQHWASHPEAIQALAFTPDNRFLLSGDDAGVVVAWDIARQQQHYALPPLMHSRAEYQLPDSPDPVTTLIVHSNRPLAVVGGVQGSITVFHPDTGVIQTQIAHQVFSGSSSVGATVKCLSFSTDGRLIAAGFSSTTRIWIWDAASGVEQEILLTGDRVRDCRFTNHDRQFLTILADSDVQRWSLTEPQGVDTWSGNISGVSAPTISPDGQMIAHGGRTYADSPFLGVPIIGDVPEPEIHLKTFDGLETVQVLAGHTGGVARLAFNYRGTLLLSSGWTKPTVKLWDLTGIAAP